MMKDHVPAGRVFGTILMIAGCCVGAGMLALPVLTAATGFKPSLLLFVLSWMYMAATGLLLLEVNLTFREEVSIISMLSATLGKVGQALGWILFTFLFYSIMVAYVSAGGQLFSDFAASIFHVALPGWAGGLAISLTLGLFLYLGTHSVDLCNRILVGGMIAAYVALVIAGAPHVKGEYLKHADWSLAAFAVPAMIIAYSSESDH
jgi:tyrosine-specific transport protein